MYGQREVFFLDDEVVNTTSNVMNNKRKRERSNQRGKEESMKRISRRNKQNTAYTGKEGGRIGVSMSALLTASTQKSACITNERFTVNNMRLFIAGIG